MTKSEAEEKADENFDTGMDLYFAGKKNESVSYFRKAVELRGDATDLHWLGSTLIDLGRCEEALPFLEKAVELRGDAVDYHWLGSANCRLRRYEEALLCLEKATKLMGDEDPKRQANNYWLGRTLFELGRYEEALPYLEKAVKLADDRDDPQWLLECLQQFQLCLDKVGDRAAKGYKAGIVTPKTHWLTRLLFGDENKHWERALEADTVEGYIQFLSKYPESIYVTIAKSKVNALQIGQQKIRNAISKIMSSDVQGNVFFTPTNRGYILKISAHLLKDYSPDDRDPMVKGAYGSKEALRSFVKRRIAEIYRVVFTSSKIKLKKVIIECRHGVHVIIGDLRGCDVATTIYSASIDGKKAAKFDWTNISIEQIQRMWRCRTDIIPSIQFKYGRG